MIEKDLQTSLLFAFASLRHFVVRSKLLDWSRIPLGSSHKFTLLHSAAAVGSIEVVVVWLGAL